MEWTRCRNTDGYARACINGNYNGKVHREVFKISYGYYPKVVRHSCDNPICINPDHLVAGDPLDNVKDRHERKRTHRQVSVIEKEQVLGMRGQGLTMKQVAKNLNINYKRVEYILTRARKEG